MEVVEEPLPIESESIPLKNEQNQKDLESLGNLHQSIPSIENNSKQDSIEFINGPAKLKKKWVDFMGGQAVVDNMGLSKDSIKRQEVIYEMIDTERDYVNDLSIIIEVYIEPLKSNNILSKKDLNTLFSNVEQIYGVNKELLSLFEKRQQQNPYVDEIGDIWLTMNEYLKMYLLYCSNYATALTKLENLKSSSKSFAKFLNTQFQKPESRCLHLDSFLIKPVQRICKYPLLLKELIKYTDESNKDYKNLKDGYAKLQTVVNVVNGASKVVEAIYSLIDFQSRFSPKINIVSSNRKIKYQCEVNIYTKKLSSPLQQNSAMDLLNSQSNIEKKKRLLYIFNDMLIIAKPLSQEYDKLDKGKLKLIEKREFSDIEIDSSSDSKDPNMANTIEIRLNNPDMMGIIFCNSENEKSELLNQLTSTLKEYQSNNTYINNPKVVKRLPSEKVYSMISNMSQDTEDLDNNLESTEGESINILPTVTERELSVNDKITIGLICAGIVIAAITLLVLSFIILDYVQEYGIYISIVALIGAMVTKEYIIKKKEKLGKTN
ncbi:Dbl homology domain-containing protein [Anaeromyces robustus]|uniref:Dbl homology domain-containing protein n=1 Tax=Anaeromyces robustus TaxID=1754192 RepID=A0A1Y1VTN3_9FUNG|nr:Dbl homology domain-containing protein [Anaeromyces robustus]|eukprot:ORX64662.1 Dbl homology domain-containing protein [Anaeromyces robustus]